MRTGAERAQRLSPACPLSLRDTTARLWAIPTPLAYHGSPGRKAPIRTPIQAGFGLVRVVIKCRRDWQTEDFGDGGKQAESRVRQEIKNESKLVCLGKSELKCWSSLIVATFYETNCAVFKWLWYDCSLSSDWHLHCWPETNLGWVSKPVYLKSQSILEYFGSL